MGAGIAAANAGNLAEAKRQFLRAVALQPKIAEGHAALGAVLLSLGELDAATRELETAHTLSPADADVDLNLANAEASQRRYPEAKALFQEALRARGAPEFSPRDSIEYATTLLTTGDTALAQSVMRSALAKAPDSAELHDGLGVVLAKVGHIADALPHFQRAVALDASVTGAQKHLGTALLDLNRPVDALQPLHAAAAAAPQDFDAQLQLGRALSAVQRDGDALEALQRAAKLRTKDTPRDALYALALALQASGDPEDSLPLFEVAISSATPTGVALTNYALARVQAGDAKGALPLYARALALGPDSPTLREDYGVAYLQESDLDDAIEQFQKGLSMVPNNPPLHYDLGLAYKLKDNLAAAIFEFQRAAELDSSLPDPFYTLGVLYMQQGRFSDAVEQFRRTTTLQPKNGDAWALLGSVLKDSGDAAGAVDSLKHAIALKPDQPNLHIQLAALELKAGDRVAAAEERKIAADLSLRAVSNQRASFALKSGRALLGDGKLDEAVTQLLIAAQADPKLVEAHRLLAEAYQRQGKSADAALERLKAESLESTGNVPLANASANGPSVR